MHVRGVQYGGAELVTVSLHVSYIVILLLSHSEPSKNEFTAFNICSLVFLIFILRRVRRSPQLSTS